MENTIKESNWTVNWKLTESMGLAIFLCDYRGKRVIWEASLPYVTIDHQKQDLTDDGAPNHGPFWMPLGARTLASDVRLNRFRGGFELVADFVTGPYRYTQIWRFHADGRVAPWLTIHGGGVHDSHTYHPHWRFDFDIKGSIRDSVEYFESDKWQAVEEEAWLPFAGQTDKHGNAWRQVGSAGGKVNIRPQASEDAELIALRYYPHDGAPSSPRNSAAGRPSPSAYVSSEPLKGDDITLWYVAHVHYGSAFPFTAGPWVACEGI